MISYSSVPNRRVGRNKRAGGKILKKTLNVQTQIRPCRGYFFLKIDKRAGEIPIQMQENKRAGGFFSTKTINVHAKIRPCKGIFFSK